MKIEILSLEQVTERNARFRASGQMRQDFELAELATRGTALFFWQPDHGEHGGFSWLCPGCGSWHFGQLGTEPVSGWDAPRWVNSGTLEVPTLTPSLGCGGWKHGTCPEGHYWLRNGELVRA